MKMWKLQKTQQVSVERYNVEPELRIASKQYAEFYLSRYVDDPSHWKDKEKRKNYIGQIGQTAFFLIQQQFYVPSDPNFPIIDWRGKKDYDFNILNLGTIEVKTEEVGNRKLLVKKSEWHGNDYVVALQLADRLPKELIFRGWLTREEVENLPIYKKGKTRYNPYSTSYMTNLTELNEPEEFLWLLVRHSLYPDKAKTELERLLKEV